MFVSRVRLKRGNGRRACGPVRAARAGFLNARKFEKLTSARMSAKESGPEAQIFFGLSASDRFADRQLTAGAV
jgi:hypothetical protein